MSDEFDAYGQLLDAAGNRLAEDDDGGGNLNARITFTLPATGQFQIVVNNFGDTRRTGLYRVWLH
jgi:serine protease Do